MSKPGFARRVWNFCMRFRDPVKRYNDQLVGVDEQGNQYFKRPRDPTKGVSKEYRYILPSEQNVTEYGDKLRLQTPLEWNAWLRFTRDTVPTDEEIQMNRLKQAQVLERAQKLKNKEMESETKEESLPYTDSLHGDPTKQSFPVLEGFEVKPGDIQRKKRQT